MLMNNILGALVIGVPLVLLAAIVLRRQPAAIRAFAIALILVGTGYLIATGAAGDIGRRVEALARGPETVREKAAPAGTPDAPQPAR